MTSSFVQRKLNFTFQYGQGQVGDAPGKSIKLTGHRATATITKAGYASMGGGEFTIYGMPLSTMNSLSTLGKIPSEVRRNIITVEAGDYGGRMTQVFQATIFQAWADFQGPDSALRVTCFAGILEAVKPVPASSYPGTVDAANVMQTLADAMELKFENNGVSVMLASPYFPGTGRQQAAACAAAGNFNWVIDNGSLAIWPLNGSRAAAKIPVISAETGMDGYPTFYSLGIAVRTIFNPDIVFGSKVQCKSILKGANGTFSVNTLQYELSEQEPDGPWFQTMECSPIPGMTDNA